MRTKETTLRTFIERGLGPVTIKFWCENMFWPQSDPGLIQLNPAEEQHGLTMEYVVYQLIHPQCKKIQVWKHPEGPTTWENENYLSMEPINVFQHLMQVELDYKFRHTNWPLYYNPSPPTVVVQLHTETHKISTVLLWLNYSDPSSLCCCLII